MSGSGKMAIMRKTIGSRSQAMELLMDIVFFFSEMTISNKRIILAMIISICSLIIFTPS